MIKLRLTLPLPTSLNKLYINEYVWDKKTKKRVPSGRRILSKEGEESKQQIQDHALVQMNSQKSNWSYDYTKTNHIYLDTIIYFNRKNRDDNNIYKLLCDSLEKICYDNDSRVLVRTQKIMYDYNNPRVEVLLHPTKYIGIFDNEEVLNKFEENCKKCKRYTRNCSILKSAKEGIIQEFVKNFKCSEFKEKS